MKILSLREQQLALLDILDYVNDICEQHHIIYSLAGGNLIGAVRHQGFIPWDDDIDIYMLRDEYEKFVKVWKSREHKRYFLESIDDIHASHTGELTKIYDRHIFLQDHHQKEMPLFLDIFIYDGVPKEEKRIYKLMKTHRRLRLRFNSCRKRWKRGKPNTLMTQFFEACSRFLFRKLEKHSQYFLRHYPLEKAEYIGLVTSGYGLLKESYMPKAWFSHIVYLDFEGRKFPCMNGYHEHLTRYCGDYLTAPPKEEQTPKHTSLCYVLDEFRE